MDDYPEVTCQAQMNIKVSVKWCDSAQFQQLCAGCPHNEGRKRSKYQIRRDKERGKP
jgi:hypothetical protein